MNFKDFNLKPEVIKWLDKLGYETPTKIQEEVIREYISGKNIIGQSQTGTGKTAAFVISLLQSIDLTKPGVQALIVAPTRELVNQIRDEILNLSIFMSIRSLPVFGGSSIIKQIEMLRKGQTIVVGTPGRLIDLIERRVLKTDQIEYFVLDEVDMMMDMGFIDDIDFIWNTMKNIKQTLAFSATINVEIQRIIQKYLWVDYTYIKATEWLTVDKIDHSFMEIPHIDKYDKLKEYISEHTNKKTIVFVQTKRDTESIARKLYDDWFNADYLNGDMRQRERFQALKWFQEWKTDIFVVTDVAARWLNIKNIDLVVNYDVPTDPEAYIHRIGRTGRAGAEWKAIMFVSAEEKFAFKNIEKRNKITIKQVDEEGNEVERKKEEPRRSGSRSGGRGFWRWSRSSWGRWGFGGGRWRWQSRPAWGFVDRSGEKWYTWESRSDDRKSAPRERNPFGWEERRSSERRDSGRSSGWFGGRSGGNRSRDWRSDSRRSDRPSRDRNDRGWRR